MSPARHVLFVCTGNTCRSPMAEQLLRHMAREAGLPWAAASAGIAAAHGSAMTPAAVKTLAARGIPSSGHAARVLDAAMLESADAVYALGREHRDALVARFPWAAPKVKVLREDAGLPGADVPDPIDRGDDAYAACLASIEEALEIILRRESHASKAR